MRTLNEIHSEIDEATERRRDLWLLLGHGHDSAFAAELKQLDARIAKLWDEHRLARAQMRFGDRSRIITRARAEERLERAA
ncbi:MAG: hypothetical protein H0V40_03970 [Actinobacteria bacterium]|nr:hypothetical protein [Actinomycetota bacterium]